MSVRQRKWIDAKGVYRLSWIVDYTIGKRRKHKTFGDDEAAARTFANTIDNIKGGDDISNLKDFLLSSTRDKGMGLDITDILVEGLPGVYFLIQYEEVVYIGQSSNVILRIVKHTQTKQFNRVVYLPCSLGEKERLKIERKMIDKYRPKYNIMSMPPKSLSKVENKKLMIARLERLHATNGI